MVEKAEKILLFGAGKAYNHFHFCCTLNEERAVIIGILDNDEKKQGTIIDGFHVYAPQKISELAYTKIIVLGMSTLDMKKQLVELGVLPDCIMTVYELYIYKDWFIEEEIIAYANDKKMVMMLKKRPKMIALFLWSFEYVGGNIAPMRMAEVLKESGYLPVIICPKDGDMRKEFRDRDIPVIIDKNIYHSTIEDREYLSLFSLIVVNGIRYHPILTKHNNNVPVIWWLHCPNTFYERSSFRAESIEWSNLSVLSVSHLAWKNIYERNPLIEERLLLYGIPETKKSQKKKMTNNERIVFVVVGTFDPVKGQDIFVQAIKLIPNEKRNKCEFWLVGDYNYEFGKHVVEYAKNEEDIIFKGRLLGREVEEIYAYSDVMVSPSREDMMPTVNGEAMMNGIPCIVTDATGTADIITDGKDGLVCKSEDAEDLARKMIWMIDNRERIPQMGIEARRLYEKYYSMETFKRNVINIVEGHIERF